MGKINLTKDNFDAEVLKSNKPVLIDFYAEWCGPCRAMAPIVEEYADAQTDVKIATLDIEKNPEISTKYGVMSIPTFVFFKEGKEIARKTGSIGKSGLEKLIAL